MKLFHMYQHCWHRVYSEIHHINTRYKSNPHLPIAHLSVYQKGARYSGIKVFNSLPTHIKEFSNNRNHLNVPWRTFCVFTHFTHWMNTSIVEILQINVDFIFCLLYYKSCRNMYWSIILQQIVILELQAICNSLYLKNFLYTHSNYSLNGYLDC